MRAVQGTLVEEAGAGSSIAAALSMSLCGKRRWRLSCIVINRAKKSNELAQLSGRILLLTPAADLSAQHVPMINCIFAAQKKGVRIDVCQLNKGQSSLLEQCCHLTAGLHQTVVDPKQAAVTLLAFFGASTAVRNVLVVPKQDQVSMQATCFCHGSPVEIGFVCSVCLSVFCKFSPVCGTCRTKFEFSAPRSLQA